MKDFFKFYDRSLHFLFTVKKKALNDTVDYFCDNSDKIKQRTSKYFMTRYGQEPVTILGIDMARTSYYCRIYIY